MMKIIVIGLCLLPSTIVLADANVDSKNREKTFLLVAPGTLSHSIKGQQNTEESLPPPKPGKTDPRRYRFVGDNYFKLRQFGQEKGLNNPWTEQRHRAAPVVRRHGATTQEFANPCHLSGAHPPGLENFQSGYPPYMPPADNMAPGVYGGLNDFYSDYTDGIYRDTNPAAFGPGFNSFMLPGLGSNDFDFPFLPF